MAPKNARKTTKGHKKLQKAKKVEATRPLVAAIVRLGHYASPPKS